ncbi:hypothetical protein O9Z70_11725 [Devosia sp. YIM 151766]|uniref:hypothetical protein n=1 Tax=Devosia sp. YIM 151766 TaxID=3017325 RepID=UPI00255CC864|nr:hypothetical protein [Devosia sp. YIM 151766]WIY52134.1 hypothetical protein O9Z70_11725 [Devosia sp. YIM 151766]
MSSSTLNLRDRHWFILIWSLVAVALIVRSFATNAGAPLFIDTDDAMHMVVARDFLAGQGWYDPIQHRLDTPYGADIHWSRLVDLPLAGLLAFSSLLFEPQAALAVTGTIWPLLLLGLLLWLSKRVTFELVGREGLLPALALPILAPAVLAEFLPGRVDHHNVVIVLTMACLLATLLALHRPLWAWLAGLAAATALSIAVEAIPGVVATILAFGLAYAADPARAVNLRRFGLGFAGFMLVHFLLARPPGRWLEAACDAISPVYVLAALAIGGAYLLVSILPAPRVLWQRLALLSSMGLAAAALVVLVYPQCLAGPYAALDPWLRDNWIAAIVEAQPWHQALATMPAYAIGVAVPILLGLLAGLVACRFDARHRLAWLILLVFITCTAFIMLAQIRGARLAVLPAVPAAAWLIVMARRAYLAHPRLPRIMALLGAWLAACGLVLVLLVNLVLGLMPQGGGPAMAETREGRMACLAPAAFADLRALPPERIMAPIDLGAHILLETPHAVVGAPYHRNQRGLLDTFRFFNGPAATARRIAEQRGLGLLVTCEALPEMHGPARDEPGTVLNLLANDILPDWLVDVSVGGPLKVYAILP